MDLNIIPEPKILELKDAVFCMQDDIRIILSGRQCKHPSKLIELLENKYDKKITIKCTEEWGIFFYLSCNGSALNPDRCCNIDKKEGYELEITPDEVLIKGHDEAGLFYGIQTLVQMLEDSSTLPCCKITDWPEMGIRGVHFDLKGCMPAFEYIKHAITRLAGYKINTILMEYEDKIIYKNHPKLATGLALNMEEVKEIIELAKENFIQIIPLVQSLGHAEYILKHSEYAYLREQQDYFQQMCPSKPETFELFTSLCEELFEVHKDLKYIHIGGDETRQLGECDACGIKAEEVGRYKVYIDYIKKACQFVLDNGKIPIIWDDILTGHAPELFEELPKGTVIAYWKYYALSGTLNYCQALNGIVTSGKWTKKQYDEYPVPNKYGPFDGASTYRKQARMFLPPGATDILEELPAGQYDFFKKYSDTDRFPEEMSSTLFLKLIRDHRLKVIGASGAHTAHDAILSNPERAIPNIRLWAKEIVKNNELGVISTAWTRNQGLEPVNGIMEGMWYAFAASGEYYWSGEGVSEKRFDEKFCRRFYGLEDLEATDAIWLIRHQNLVPGGKRLYDIFIELSKKAKRNKENLRYHALISKLFQIANSIDVVLDSVSNYYYMKNYKILEDRMHKKYNNQLFEIYCMIEDSKVEMKEIYSRTLHPDEVEDCIHSYFGWYDRLIDFLNTL